jgi:REP element-mobilizing transposase RayT
MSEYRRSFINGGTFFFTVVTYQRQPILTDPLSRDLLRDAWQDVSNRFPFTSDAFCLLPDHLHCILTLPQGDSNYPIRWREIKRIFTRTYLSYKKNQSKEIYPIKNVKKQPFGNAVIGNIPFAMRKISITI